MIFVIFCQFDSPSGLFIGEYQRPGKPNIGDFSRTSETQSDSCRKTPFVTSLIFVLTCCLFFLMSVCTSSLCGSIRFEYCNSEPWCRILQQIYNLSWFQALLTISCFLFYKICSCSFLQSQQRRLSKLSVIFSRYKSKKYV